MCVGGGGVHTPRVCRRHGEEPIPSVVRVAGGHLEMDILRSYRSISISQAAAGIAAVDVLGWVLRALLCLFGFGTIQPKQQQQLAVVPAAHGLVQVTTQAQSAGELIYAAAVYCAPLRAHSTAAQRTDNVFAHTAYTCEQAVK